jgi:transposase InsO family protein
LETIHKILTRHDAKPLKRNHQKHQYKRYQRPIPGDWLQPDTMKVAPGLFQYAAIDDCSRFHVQFSECRSLCLSPRLRAQCTKIIIKYQGAESVKFWSHHFFKEIAEVRR